MRLFLAVGLLLLVNVPVQSRVVPTWHETTYTSDAARLTIRADRRSHRVFLTFSKKDAPGQTVSLNSAEWHAFLHLYREACNRLDPTAVVAMESIGALRGIEVAVDAYFPVYAPFPGGVPLQVKPQSNIVLSCGDVSVVVNRAFTFPLDQVIETAQAELGSPINAGE